MKYTARSLVSQQQLCGSPTYTTRRSTRYTTKKKKCAAQATPLSHRLTEFHSSEHTNIAQRSIPRLAQIILHKEKKAAAERYGIVSESSCAIKTIHVLPNVQKKRERERESGRAKVEVSPLLSRDMRSRARGHI